MNKDSNQALTQEDSKSDDVRALDHRGKQYVVPDELLANVPVFTANHVVTTVSPEGVSIVFCTKLDSMAGSEDSLVAVPRCCVFVSVPQADGLASNMRSLLDALMDDLRTRMGKTQNV